MRIRPANDTDIPKLRKMMQAFPEYPYCDLLGGTVEGIWVAVEENEPIMAVIAERILQLYLIPGDLHDPSAKLHMLRALHETMGAGLKKRGWPEVNAFLPPQIGVRFGKRLVKTFGWVENWRSWCKRL